MRLFQFTAEADCLLCAATQLAGINNDSSIRIFHVLQSALGKTAIDQFPHGISIRNPPEFIKASSWTPAATIDAVFQRHVERSAIDASLSAGNNFHLPLGMEQRAWFNPAWIGMMLIGSRHSVLGSVGENRYRLCRNHE